MQQRQDVFGWLCCRMLGCCTIVAVCALMPHCLPVDIIRLLPCLFPRWLQEFIDYFFLQRAASSVTDSCEDWRLHPEVGAQRGTWCCGRCSLQIGPEGEHGRSVPILLQKRSDHCKPALQDHWRREWRGVGHKEAVERVYCCGSLGQYVTGGRGGALRWGVLACVLQQGSGRLSTDWTECVRHVLPSSDPFLPCTWRASICVAHLCAPLAWCTRLLLLALRGPQGLDRQQPGPGAGAGHGQWLGHRLRLPGVPRVQAAGGGGT